MKKLFFMLCLLFGGCVRLPPGVQPVQKFNLNTYLGRWYEIARLDHSFERGLSQVTAEYTMGVGATVNVVNRGYSSEKKRWEVAEGKARFVASPEEGFLKVSFFGPFYGAYVIFELDQERYQYALVSGPDTSYLWVLGRQPNLPEDILERLVNRARDLGFPVDKLIFVSHEIRKSL